MNLEQTALTALIDRGAIIEGWATAIVLIGVAGEFVAELTALIHSEKWKKRTVITSTLLVIAGIAGELFAQGKLSNLNGRLDATIEKEAGDANQRAALIEQASAWRLISTVDRVKMELSLGTGHGSVTVAYMEADPESELVAFQIASAFNNVNSQAGSQLWHVEIDPRIYSDRVIFGVIVSPSDNETTKLVRRAFDEGKVAYEVGAIPANNFTIGGITIGSKAVTTDAVILVGSKRPPNL